MVSIIPENSKKNHRFFGSIQVVNRPLYVHTMDIPQRQRITSLLGLTKQLNFS